MPYQHVTFHQTGSLAVGGRLLTEDRRSVQSDRRRSNSLTLGHRACQGCGEALGARYALGWWVRDGVLDHEGSVGGYQSLLMLVPEREVVLAVLTNSWKGSALIQELVEALGLTPPAPQSPGRGPTVGSYGLESVEAVVTRSSVTESEPDPVTGVRVERRYPLSLDAPLMSWRTDFPRPGVARVGWVALPRVAS